VKEKEDANYDKPTMYLDYNVSTLSEKFEGGTYPSIYVHTEGDGSNNSRGGYFKGYILATGIEWDFTFSIPNHNNEIKIKTESRPNSSFSGLRNQGDAYYVMMQSAFENYAAKIADDFGL